MDLKIKRAVEEIRLGDEPDAPVFYLDLSDSRMVGMVNDLDKLRRRVGVAQGKLAEAKEQDDIIEGLKTLAKICREIIALLLGKKAEKQIIAYIKGGQNMADYEVATSIALVAVELTNVINDRYVNPLAQFAERAYLGDQAESDFKVI